jgi:hypothetical protein
VAGLFVPMLVLSVFMYWPHRYDVRLGFFAFVLLSWSLCIRKPDPKGTDSPASPFVSPS